MAFPHSNTQNVIILGGSLSGLMHALTILQHSTNTPNRKVTILERSPTALLHNQGAGVVAGPEVQTFFTDYVRAGRDIAVHSQQRLYLNRSGGIVEGSVEDRVQRMTSWDVLYRLLRWRVDGMSAEGYVDQTASSDAGNADQGFGEAAYEYGCTVTGLVDLGSKGVEVKWTDREGGERTQIADLVIAADGASSAARKIVVQQSGKEEVQRKYVGYVAFRGTVPEKQLSDAATKVFSEKFAFFHTQGCQILGYLIPGENGTLNKGERLMNWVWYWNFADGSNELEDLMTDNEGRRHGITLPVGGMKDTVWERQKGIARDVLPPQYAEIVGNTTHPFVQAITDVVCPENMFMDDKVVLVGDALAGFRPHTAASTGQAAFDALQLGKWMSGKVDRDEYRNRCLHFSKELQEQGVRLGERSQFGRHPLAG